MIQKIINRKSSKLQPGKAMSAVVRYGLLTNNRALPSKLILPLCILLAPVILTQVSCKKFVTVDPPVTQLVTASVFDNDAAATAAQTVIYTKMAGNLESYYLEHATGLMSDEFANYSSNNLPYYQNSITATTDYVGPWSTAYNYIYQANAIIEGLQKTSGVNAAIKKQLIGESKFIRAFWFFYLVNLYGDVPLTTTTDYSVNGVMARTPKDEVYKQMITDLQDAESLLNDGYVDASDTTVYPIASAERVRPTKAAAEALLARVYLYQAGFTHSSADYANAEAQATEVINNTAMFSLLSDLDQVFLKNSREAIWQLAIPLPATANTAEGFHFILLAAPTDVSISNQLLSSFESGDLRRTHWIQDTTISSVTYSYPYKYKVQSGSTITEYEMVLRLSEQYLIRAEARAEQNNLNGAVADLNAIRNRAGLADYSGTMDQASILAAILHERQDELFTEWGNRWFDLIRTGTINSVMGAPSNVCASKGGTWSSDGHQTLYPISLTEIGKDVNLTQNPGY